MEAQQSCTSYDIVNDMVAHIVNDFVNVANDIVDDMVGCAGKPRRAAHRTTSLTTWSYKSLTMSPM